jgi:hypothetical protein
VLVLEPVEHAGLDQPASRFARVLQRRELEEDEDVVRIVDAAKDAARRRRLAGTRPVLVEERPPCLVVTGLDPRDDECGRRATSLVV